MKKVMTLLVVGFLTTNAMYAQSALELAKQQRQLDKINMEMVDAKSSKSAKKEAKKLEKEGWKVPVGGDALASQITRGQLMSKELMADENGNPVRRYILHTAIATSGTETAGYAAARTRCQTEIAAMLKTKLAAAFATKVDNAQQSAINATTVDKFNERGKSVIDAMMTMMTPVIHIYRVLPNNNYQVQVQVAYDKEEMKAQLKREFAKDLEEEGDENLNGIVDEVLRGELQ